MYPHAPTSHPLIQPPSHSPADSDSLGHFSCLLQSLLYLHLASLLLPLLSSHLHDRATRAVSLQYCYHTSRLQKYCTTLRYARTRTFMERRRHILLLPEYVSRLLVSPPTPHHHRRRYHAPQQVAIRVCACARVLSTHARSDGHIPVTRERTGGHVRFRCE